MEHPVSAIPRYLLRLDQGATAGPYTEDELRDLLETGRIAPTDQLQPEGSRAVVSVDGVIADAAGIHGRRKSDRLRRKSDRLAAVQASEQRKSDLLRAISAQAAEVHPPEIPATSPEIPPPAPVAVPSSPGDSRWRPTRWQAGLLLGGVAGLLVLVLFWNGSRGDSPPRMRPATVLGTWELATSPPTPPWGGLRLVVTQEALTVVSVGGKVTSPWVMVSSGAQYVTLELDQAHPVLGFSIRFVTTPQGLALERDGTILPLRPGAAPGL